MKEHAFNPNSWILGLTILAVFSTAMAWYITLHIINNGYGYEANPFSLIIHDHPFLALARNLAVVGIVGYVAHLYSKRTKFAYVPVLFAAYIFFGDYIRDLTNLLLAWHLFG